MRYWKSYLLYVPVLFVFIVMNAVLPLLSLNDLLILLKPVSSLINLFTGNHPVFIKDYGFHFSDLNIVIGASCSGYNFWALCFLLIAASFLKISKANFSVWIIIPLAILLSYVLTLLVNTIRIMISIYTQEIGDIVLTKRPHFLIHEITGTLVYVFSLFLIFLLISSFQKQISNNNEKPA